MKKIIIGFLVVLALVVLWFTTPIGLFLTAIPCGLSPECSTNISVGDTDKVVARAVAAKQVTICDTLPKEIWFSTAAPRSDCYFGYAKETKDVRACGSLLCHVEVARISGDVSVCDAISADLPYSPHPYNITYYKTDCYIGAAAASHDKTICNKVTGDDRLKCLWPFSDRSICEEYPQGARGYGFCIEYFDNKEKYGIPRR